MTDKSKYAEEKEFASFEEFYPLFLKNHSKPLTKLVHLIGTTLGMLIMLLFWIQLYEDMASANFKLIGLAFFVGYAFAYFSHFFIEKNLPTSW